MTAAPAQPELILMFEAGGQSLAIAADQVAEVVATPRVTRVPQAPASLHGVANLRGRVVPILSVQTLLGAPVGAASSRVIVLNGENPVGLAVDRVSAMCFVPTAGASPEGDGLATLVDTDAGPARLLQRGPLLAAAFQGLRTRAAEARAPERPAAAAADQKNADVAFLQFALGGQAYALPLEQVREVMRVPAIAALPQADEALLGVMPLRGDLLALVSVRALLGLPPTLGDDATRVIVATLGDTNLGLVVNSVTAILRVQDGDVGAVPGILNRGAGEARIDAIVRSPGGLVSLLATERIFLEQTVAEIIAEGAGREASKSEPLGIGGVVEQFVLFRLADETYGLPVAAVREVVRLPDVITRAPRAPAYVAGLMNHRGVVVPLIDQRRRFAVAGEAATRQQRVIVASLDDLVAGFIVDSVEQVLDVPTESLRTAPELTAADETIFDRIATLDVEGKLVLLVDPRQLLDQAERDIVRDLARRPNAENA